MKPKLLIVDDNSMLRETTRSILQSKFPALRVFEAGNGKEAFAQIHDHPPDLILMDIRLHGENGLDLTKEIKARYPRMKVIIFTSHDLPEYRRAAFENGARYFLSKSSNGLKLRNMVAAIFSDAGLSPQ